MTTQPKTKIPPVFAQILAAKDFDPIRKYQHFYEGIAPNELASVDAGKAFLPYIAELAAAKSPVGLPTPTLVAIPSGMQTTAANIFLASDLTDDGFPSDIPIHLFLRFDGDKEEDQFVGKQRIVNVAMAIRKYFSNPDGLWLDIVQG